MFWIFFLWKTYSILNVWLSLCTLSNLFKNATIDDDGIQKHPADATGKSITNTVYFEFKSGAGAKVGCAKFSKEIKEKHNTYDQLRVSVNTKEYANWLRDEAY